MFNSSKLQLEGLSSQIKKLDINDEIKDEINQCIDEYNSLVIDQMKQIDLINREVTGKLSLPNIIQLNDTKNSTVELAKKLEDKINKLKILLNDYDKINTLSLQYEIEIENQQYYNKLIKQCLDKKRLQLEGLRLEQQKKMHKKKIFDDFELVIQTYKNLIKINSETKQKLNADKEGFLEQLRYIVTTHNKLKENKALLKTQLHNMNENNKKIDIEIKQLAKCMFDPNITISFQLNNILIDFKDRDVELLQIYHELLQNEISIKVKNQEQFKCNEKYVKAKAGFDEMSIAITTIRESIKKENISKCPVCKTVFENTEALLEKLDTSAQQEQVDYVYKKYIDCLNELQELKNNQKRKIDNWNEKCEKTRQIKLSEYINNRYIDKLEQDITAIDNELNLIETKKQSFVSLLNQYHIFDGKLTSDNFFKWWNICVVEIENQINGAYKDVETFKKLRDKILSDSSNLSI